MSGEIFQQIENSDDGDFSWRSPLLCYLCHEQYEEPCILKCCHSFCAKCLCGRDVDGWMACPLCRAVTQLKEGETIPPQDLLLKFLLESSSEEKTECANCDTNKGHMFFCNTCAQPLCTTCREETHKAKMFARHEIILLSKKTKEIHMKCVLHEEQYIMFSTEKKVMLCINCFRDMKIESRVHCVDLDTAFSQGCKKLDQAVQTTQDLQNSVKEGISMLRTLLKEIKHNAEVEKEAITQLYDLMQEKITEKKKSLLEEVDRQYQQKQNSFKVQLLHLNTLLPTLHVNLVTSSAFSSSANKFEFLNLSSLLIERFQFLAHQQYTLRPTHSGQIYTDHKNEFAKCLEPLLFPDVRPELSLNAAVPLSRSSGSSPPHIRLELSKLSLIQGSSSTAPASLTFNLSTCNVRRSNGHKNSIVKFIDAKGPFADHCLDFDMCHRDLLQKLERLKSEAQELQRDLTLRRCMARRTVIIDLKNIVKIVGDKLHQHNLNLEHKQSALEKHWEESVQRIANEQELYQAQLNDAARLEQDCHHLLTIVTQLSSFISSISAVTERIAPKLGQSSKEADHENQIHALFEQINTMTPDSQHRYNGIALQAGIPIQCRNEKLPSKPVCSELKENLSKK